MQLTKYTHACVRLERDGKVLVIDPGIWSEPHALLGAHAVLVTHEHSDHIDQLRLAGLGVPVYAPAGAKIRDLDVVPVDSGDEFTAAGFRVRAVGGRHATVYDGLPDCANLGYLVDDGAVYHPGDALHVPDQPVHTLLAPAHGSWMRLDQAIDFIRAVRPQRTFAIHDAQINERGLESVNDWFAERADGGYRWLAPGQTA